MTSSATTNRESLDHFTRSGTIVPNMSSFDREVVVQVLFLSLVTVTHISYFRANEHPNKYRIVRGRRLSLIVN